jgi:hypothetical protein
MAECAELTRIGTSGVRTEAALAAEIGVAAAAFDALAETAGTQVRRATKIRECD